MTPAREIRLLEDEAEILSILAGDPRWTAYALCDLDPPYREKARFIGSLVDGRPEALVLLYRLGGTHALLAFGEVDGVHEAMRRYQDLPDRTFVILLPRYLPSLQERYVLEDHWTVLRMVLDPANFRPTPTGAGPQPVRLSENDLPAIRDLYHHWGSTFFNPTMLEHGVYFGVYDGPHLLAIAGTHAVSVRRGVAAIGGVFTHPDYRGQGLATAATSAVVSTVVAMGVTLVVLNVVEDNAPAIAVYQRLGFEAYHSYVEGHAERSFKL